MKSKTKPVVKYRKSKRGYRYKETLVGTITGQAARWLNQAHESGECLIHSYNTSNMEKLELWREEILD